MVKLLVFDWDGTLMDSEAQIVACMEDAIKDMACPIRTPTEIRNIIGLGLVEAVATLYPDKDKPFVQQLADRYRHHFLSQPSDTYCLFEGAEDVIKHFHTQGYLLAVATGKGRRGLDKVLLDSGLGEFFHATRCADETFSKPHPQMLEEILDELGVSASDAVMIGDTEYDLQMATNAGVKSIGVSYGVHDVDRLEQHQPLVILDNISELKDILVSEDWREKIG